VSEVSESVHVASIEALEEFANRYRHFVANVSEILDGVKSAYFRQYEEMLKAVIRQQQRVQELREHYQNSNQEEDESDYMFLLQEAEERLTRMQIALHRVEEQWEIYRKVEMRVRHLGGELGPKAKVKLRDISEHLRTYTAVAPPGEQVTSGTSQITEGLGSVSIPSGASQHRDVIDLSHYALPEGFRWIPVEEIEIEEVPEIEFRKVDYETMKKGFEKLLEVLERLQDRLNNPFKPDQHDNSSYFWRLDRQAGRSYEEGLQRVYDAFFGTDHIRLSRFKGSPRWTIDNGRHRIQMARDLGWKFIPAKVVEVERGGSK
jgi:hypothetical protein